MSRLQNERDMDRSYEGGGSVRRARERAEAGYGPRTRRQDAPPSIPRLPIRNPNNGTSRPQAAGSQMRDGGNFGATISRPTQVPQWPLAGPIASPSSSDGSEPYRPPPGRSEPPQRPPRPSRVPSILDGSRIQDHTPVFQYAPQNQRASELSIPETPATSGSSRPTTQSSVGSIPDFPLPTVAPIAPPVPPPPPPRRSVNLGPPPSSRRGNSAFYSTASYVSPIPEESPKTRSHTSYASSAAIPESFGTISPGLSQDGFYYDDTIAEESVYSDDADERGLVRSASIGRKGKPSLVTTRSTERGEMVPIVLPFRPEPRPMQSPFSEGTGFIDGSSTSSGAASSKTIPPVGAALTTDNMLGAFEGAAATDPSSVRKATPSPLPFKLSALRRPPRLDIDAVRDAEARGSLTSLPDLIRRATRAAALLDKGRRPASRFDDLMDFPPEIYNPGPERDFAYDNEKHQSGLSDMLAAFPPPAQAQAQGQGQAQAQANTRRSIRQSGSSWPLPIAARRASSGGSGGPGAAERATGDASPVGSQQKKGRRCCGLPLWGFLLLSFILVLIITAAIIVPLEFFVIQPRNASSSSAQPDTLSGCQAQLTCANGGTNVITDGVCSCICTNGFTGNDCTTSSTQGCTTTTLSSTDTTLRNVTLGEAIPRLVQEAQSNFSIPLSATSILSKFNSANLSCIAENALVTFDGQSTRLSVADISDPDISDPNLDSDLVRAGNAVPITVTIQSGISLTLTIENPGGTGSFSVIISTLTEPLNTFSGSFSTIFRTTLSDATTTSPSSTTTATTENPTSAATTETTATGTGASTITSASTTSTATTETAATGTSTTSAATSTATFDVTAQVFDFARVGVLFVLQSTTLADAATAQSSLQQFFTSASSTEGVPTDQARSVSMGGGNTIDLVHFLINLK
ncbi:hypothetical protein BJ170DRAFT_304406 [Xylariales sp. AK1849]|nr:hypothetical protein BJ170DRAFT_304406 [Xylariales sp. AK1849]